MGDEERATGEFPNEAGKLGARITALELKEQMVIEEARRPKGVGLYRTQSRRRPQSTGSRNILRTDSVIANVC